MSVILGVWVPHIVKKIHIYIYFIGQKSFGVIRAQTVKICKQDIWGREVRLNVIRIMWVPHIG